MAEQHEEFKLEKLDQLMEELAQLDPSQPETRLLQDLARVYKARERIAERASARVWQRLQTGERPGKAVSSSMPSIPSRSATDTPRKGLLTMQTFQTPDAQHKKRGRSLITSLVAALIVGILVSAFAILPRFYQAQPGPAASTQATLAGAKEQALYVTWREALYKLDKKTGKVLWTFIPPNWKTFSFVDNAALPVPGQMVKVIATNDDTAYIAVRPSSINKTRSTLYALYAANGQVRWKYTPTPGEELFGQVIQSGNALYLQTSIGQYAAAKNYLLALNAQNGHVLWHVQLQEVSASGAYSFEVRNGFVYLSYDDYGYPKATSSSFIEALNASHGIVAWRSNLGKSNRVSNPLATDTLVYVNVSSQEAQPSTVLEAFDAHTGQQKWISASFPGGDFEPLPFVLANGGVYMGVTLGPESNTTGKVYTLDATNGKQVRVYDLPVDPGEMLVATGRLYVSYFSHGGPSPSIYQTYGSYGLLALNLDTGHQVWLNAGAGSNAGQPITNPPTGLQIDSSLSFATIDGLVEVVSPTTGAPVWQQQLVR